MYLLLTVPIATVLAQALSISDHDSCVSYQLFFFQFACLPSVLSSHSIQSDFAHQAPSLFLEHSFNTLHCFRYEMEASPLWPCPCFSLWPWILLHPNFLETKTQPFELHVIPYKCSFSFCFSGMRCHLGRHNFPFLKITGKKKNHREEWSTLSMGAPHDSCRH